MPVSTSPFYSSTNVCEITPQEVAKVITDCVLSNKKSYVSLFG